MMFYKETNFKDTPIGKIPKDWGVRTVKDLGEVITGTTPRTSIEEYWNGEYPFVTPTDITENKYVINTERKVTEKGLHRGRLIPRDSVLVTCIASIGKIALASESCVTNQQINAIICKRDVDPHYVYYATAFRTGVLRTWAGQTTNPIVKKSLFEKFPLPLPRTVGEQQKITSFLSIADEAIQKTNEVIAKTERLKKGLMQELLTKGIGHKEFKDTPIGKIPKEWNVVKLCDVILEAKSGFASGKRDEHGILQLRMDNIETEGWINPEAGVKVPTPSNVEKYILKPNDILFNNTNSVDLIGKTAIFRGEISRCVYSNHLTRIRVNLDRVIPEWILFVLIRKWQTSVFKAICHRHVHQAGINNSDLLNIKIPIPKIPEQQKIDQILSTADKKLKLERHEKTRLERIKQGLMDLLLTGKVRVKVA